eukprot:524898_1
MNDTLTAISNFESNVTDTLNNTNVLENSGGNAVDDVYNYDCKTELTETDITEKEIELTQQLNTKKNQILNKLGIDDSMNKMKKTMVEMNEKFEEKMNKKLDVVEDEISKMNNKMARYKNVLIFLVILWIVSKYKKYI